MGAISFLFKSLLKLIRLASESLGLALVIILALWITDRFEGDPDPWLLVLLSIGLFVAFSILDLAPIFFERNDRINKQRELAKKQAADIQARSEPLPTKYRENATTSSGRPAVAPFGGGFET